MNDSVTHIFTKDLPHTRFYAAPHGTNFPLQHHYTDRKNCRKTKNKFAIILPMTSKEQVLISATGLKSKWHKFYYVDVVEDDNTISMSFVLRDDEVEFFTRELKDVDLKSKKFGLL